MDCAECPPRQPTPITVVPDCVEGQCLAVELQEQEFAQCDRTEDCVIQPVDCCGFCGTALEENAYSFNRSSDYQPCPDSLACPDIGCPPTTFNVAPSCGAGGVCELVFFLIEN